MFFEGKNESQTDDGSPCHSCGYRGGVADRRLSCSSSGHRAAAAGYFDSVPSGSVRTFGAVNGPVHSTDHDVHGDGRGSRRGGHDGFFSRSYGDNRRSSGR